MSNRVVCPSHPDANLIEDYHAGDMICSECGLVVGDRVIDVGEFLKFLFQVLQGPGGPRITTADRSV